jgi:hypothetical protein
MEPYEGPHTVLTIELQTGVYLAFIMDCYEIPLIALTIALHVRPLHTHYNGTL